MHGDQTAERISAVAGALRTAQHFNVIHIKQRSNRADATEIYVIDQKADRGIRRALVLIQLADAANLEVTRAIGIARPIEVRHQTDHVLEMLLASGVQGCRVQHRDAGGNLLDGLITQQRRGDDDLWQNVTGCISGVVCMGCGGKRSKEPNRNECGYHARIHTCSLRRHYPDQVQRVRRTILRLRLSTPGQQGRRKKPPQGSVASMLATAR